MKVEIIHYFASEMNTSRAIRKWTNNQVILSP